MNKKLQRLSSLLRTWLAPLVAVSIIAGIFCGLIFPDVSQSLDALIPITVFAMLYPPLINIDLGGLRRDFTNVPLIGAIIVLNFILAPLAGALYAQLLSPIDPLLAVGFILKLSVPAAPMVVAWTGLADGRTETALTAVTFSYILSFFFIPFWTFTLVGTIVTVPVALFMNSLVIYVAVPLIAGILSRQVILRYKSQEALNSVKPALPPISSIGMFGIVFIIMAREASMIISHLSSILIIVVGIIIIYPLLFLLSTVYSKYAGFDYGDTIAMDYTVTAKSHGLTIALAISTFGGLSVLPAAIAPIIQIPLMILILHAGPKLRKFIDGSEERGMTRELATPSSLAPKQSD
jgi:ACR3 family arsenite transporter